MSSMKDETLSLEWRKSRYSIGDGDCVEIATINGQIVVINGRIAVRDSKDSAGPILRFCAGSWRLFLSEARLGTYDRLPKKIAFKAVL